MVISSYHRSWRLIQNLVGFPDCKLIKPFKMVVSSDEYKLETWLDFTSQNEMMIHSDSILTIVTPTAAILSEYVDLIA